MHGAKQPYRALPNACTLWQAIQLLNDPDPPTIASRHPSSQSAKRSASPKNELSSRSNVPSSTL